MQVISSIKNGINKTLLVMSMCIMAFLTLLMFANIVGRFLNHSIFWAEEVCRLCQVWITFLASPLVLERAEHPGFKALPNKMKTIGKKIVWISSNILVLLVNWWLFYYGVQLVQSSNYTSANGIPRFVFILPAILGGFYSMIVAIDKVVQIIKLTPEEAETWKA